MATLFKQTSLDEKTEDILQILSKIVLTVINSLFRPIYLLKDIYRDRTALKEKRPIYPYLNHYLYFTAVLFVIVEILKVILIETHNTIKIDRWSTIKSESIANLILDDIIHLLFLVPLSIFMIIFFFYIIEASFNIIAIAFIYGKKIIYSIIKRAIDTNTTFNKTETRTIEVIKTASFYFIGSYLIIHFFFDEVYRFQLAWLNYIARLMPNCYLLFIGFSLVIFFFTKNRQEGNNYKFPLFLKAFTLSFTTCILSMYMPVASKNILTFSLQYWGTLEYKHKVPIFGLKGDDTIFVNSVWIDSAIQIELTTNIQNLYPYDIILPKNGTANLIAQGNQIDTVKISIPDSTVFDFLTINNGQVRTIKLTGFLDTSSFKRIRMLPDLSNTGYKIKFNYLPIDKVEKDYSKDIFLKFN